MFFSLLVRQVKIQPRHTNGGLSGVTNEETSALKQFLNNKYRQCNLKESLMNFDTYVTLTA
jgi:hypothetical protein